ncbi:hypothetical protein AV530_014967 [Patagioenas fasciata monilis]|uniref:Uncharacterized protein n=1 Tax=Patagioenas fasciata monilis TaxID=372326 RepID=A0A1V4K0H5_PATFA|nr:hypothetical protein AV530_014967 [Patagioenas fasciata monilis]
MYSQSEQATGEQHFSESSLGVTVKSTTALWSCGNLFAWLFVLLSPWLYAVNLKIIRDSCMVAQTSPSSSGISGSK